MTIGDVLDRLDLRAARPVVVGVAQRGEQTLCAAGAPLDARFRIASLTKTFTAVALVRAASTGGVPLDAPARDLLPQLADDWAADPGITLSHLLAQTSGLTSTLSGADIASLGDGPDAVTCAARMTVRQGSRRAPGERWEYYNGNYFLAGALIEELTGRSYEGAMTDLVLAPFGLARTGFGGDAVPGTKGGTTLPAPDYPRGRRPSGGLVSTATDVLTFGGHLMSDPHLLACVAQVRTAARDPLRFGLGWALGPSGQMYVNGRLPGYRAVLLALPGSSVVVVALSADEDALPTLAAWVSAIQQPVTEDDIADAIVAFAA